jgi:hypothetical protein
MARSVELETGAGRWLAVALLLAAVTGLGGATACKTDELDKRTSYTCPNRTIFARYVSALMEQRCGMLDCHGSMLRPMRIYGQYGLRTRILEPGDPILRTGEAPTENQEIEFNYRSVCAVEPEAIDEVARTPGGQQVNRLLLVRKARGQEGHKGGKVFNPFDDADKCVVGWLRGDHESSVAKACKAALARLP